MACTALLMPKDQHKYYYQTLWLIICLFYLMAMAPIIIFIVSKSLH